MPRPRHSLSLSPPSEDELVSSPSEKLMSFKEELAPPNALEKPAYMDVTFETPRGRRFTVEVWYFATVREMKERILEHEGIPVESQRLFFEGRELEDGRDAEHYAILQGSHVLLVPPDDSSHEAAVHVVVSAPALGRSIALDIPASDTVARLKELLQERSDGALPAARATVFFDKAEMEDGKALADYNPPVDGMEVCAVVRQPPAANAGAKNQQRMSVKVKWGTKTVALEVSALDVVKELRRELERAAPHLRLPERDGYFFVYKQNVMEDDRTLRWHEVKNGDTIEIFNGSVTGGA